MCEVDLLDSFGHELEWQIQRNGDFLSSDESVRIAFAAWLRADKWKGSLTRSEAGKLGAAKRELNRVLRRRGLSFETVAKALV